MVEDGAVGDAQSVSTKSQVSDDPALKDSSSGNYTTDNSTLTPSEEASKFVKKETQHVFYLRVMVILLLFSASAAISLVVYFVTDNGEDDSFEAQYYAAADKVMGKSKTRTSTRCSRAPCLTHSCLLLLVSFDFDRNFSSYCDRGV